MCGDTDLYLCLVASWTSY